MIESFLENMSFEYSFVCLRLILSKRAQLKTPLQNTFESGDTNPPQKTERENNMTSKTKGKLLSDSTEH